MNRQVAKVEAAAAAEMGNLHGGVGGGIGGGWRRRVKGRWVLQEKKNPVNPLLVAITSGGDLSHGVACAVGLAAGKEPTGTCRGGRVRLSDFTGKLPALLVNLRSPAFGRGIGICVSTYLIGEFLPCEAAVVRSTPGHSQLTA